MIGYGTWFRLCVCVYCVHCVSIEVHEKYSFRFRRRQYRVKISRCYVQGRNCVFRREFMQINGLGINMDRFGAKMMRNAEFYGLEGREKCRRFNKSERQPQRGE